MIGIISSGQQIITSGLVLNIDAAQLRSYPTSGTTWTDLSGNDNTATLTNGPTFNSSDGGAIVFDGVNQYAAISNSSTVNPNTGSFTIQTWVNSDPSSGGDGWDLWVAKRVNGSNGYYVGVNNPAGCRFMLGNDAGNRTDTSFIGYTYNTWAMFTAILDVSNTTQTIIRNNYDESNTTTPFGGNYYNTGTLSIGGDIGINAYYVNGRIAITLLYNRALSSTEVSQNFNAMRSRYGI